MALKWLNRDLIVGPYLALALSEGEFHAALRHCKVPISDWPKWVKSHATTHTLTNPDGGLTCVVCLGPHEGKTPVQVAALLVHEAVHVFQSWRDDVGEREPSSELEAYSIQAISQRLMQGYSDRADTKRRPKREVK